MSFLAVEGVRKRFGATVAVDGVDLAIAKGELFALLGGSGCGKSTLLRCLAGFETPDEGRILLDGQDITATPPYARPVNMMFQSYALFPHMDVASNVGFGLRQDGLPKPEIARRVEEMLALVQLERFGGRRPAQLSGGQRARVALARALAKRPLLLLLDEPLSALDRNLREAMQRELVGIQHRTGTTFVVVTHDQQEALAMASRIGVMDRGRLVQVGTPAEVYEAPNSRFVATFLGAANILEGTVTEAGPDGLRIATPGAEIVAPGRAEAGAHIAVALRAEHLRIEPAGAAGPNRARGTLRDVAYRGEGFTVHVALDAGGELRVSRPNRRGAAPPVAGEAVTVAWDPDAAVVLTA
ncbi:ABC transporter ATP-binding protein [Falsiroseomonas sp. HW251]|uniref:ABC transporter ATP-binding protein n=1 Tax=Falsiroseomonas sp. HW251 TaxID=3390998 RepID=UPI003D312F5E